ncbi:MAG TPA: hypothetical protein VFG76_04655, partial [Candidatus Polarisedimenticolia bacterium]|nr:hypothetical protein [Candidatus Polarisedimenticolia bacterium]
GRLLAKKPSERYSDAARLLADLRALQLGKPLASPSDAETPSTGAISEIILDRAEEGSRSAPGSSGTTKPTFLTPHRKALVALLTVCGFCAGVALLALMTGRPAPKLEPANAGVGVTRVTTIAPAAADLTLRLAHSLKAGNISLAMDGKPLMSVPFRGEWSKMKVQGALSRKLQVPAGRHEFTVTVLNEEGRQWTGSTTRQLEGGADPVLFVEVKGFLRKNLDLTWY